MIENLQKIFGDAAGARASELVESLENPVPHLQEAKEALFQVAKLQKDLWLLDAETKAKEQLRRVVFAALALVCLIVCGTMTIFWLSMSLHEQGWSAGTLSLVSLILFGGMTGFLGWLAIRSSSSVSATSAVKK